MIRVFKQMGTIAPRKQKKKDLKDTGLERSNARIYPSDDRSRTRVYPCIFSLERIFEILMQFDCITELFKSRSSENKSDEL